MNDRQELYGREEAAYLRLWVGFEGAPDARETGRIVERIANAFSQESRGERRGRPRLAITGLSVGSLLAEMKAVFEGGGAILSLLEQRELLGSFLQRIAIAIQVLKDSGGGASASIRSLLAVIVSPIAAGRASGAQLSVSGNNNIVIVIDRADATELHRIISALAPTSGGGSGVGPGYFSTNTERLANDQLGSSAFSPDGVNDRPAVERHPQAAIPTSLANRKFQSGRGPPIPLTDVEHLATAFQVDGEWYARAEGYGGSLLPVVFDNVDASKLNKANRYTVAGTIEARAQGGRFRLTRIGKRRD